VLRFWKRLICKEIIESHNGKIEIDSIPGKGTEVVFHIPAHGKGRNNAKNSFG